MSDNLDTNENEDLIHNFVGESRDMLEEVEPVLIELQMNAEATGALDDETINSIFRLFHSMKGSAGFLQLKNVAALTHEAETLLDLFRKGKAELSSRHTELLCSSCDLIRNMLERIEDELNDEGFEEEVKDGVAKLAKMIEEESKNSATPTASTNTKTQESSLEVDDMLADLSALQNAEEAEASTDSSLEEKESDDEFDLVISKEMIDKFLQEADEQLENVEQILLELGNNPGNPSELIAEAFRCIHSFKGNCGFCGFDDMERLSHKTETVLDEIRSENLQSSDESTRMLLSIIDSLQTSVAALSNGESANIPGCDVMIELLSEMLPKEEDEPQLLGEILVADGDTTQGCIEDAMNLQGAPLGEILVDMGAVPQETVSNALAKQEKRQKKSPAATGTKTIKRRDIRVDISKLDALMNLVGELVISQIMVTNNPDLNGLELENFERESHRLHRITSELQDVAVTLRMIPISGTFRKMIRLVYDLSKKSGKKIDLKLIGEETDVDKTVIELIADPLVHIVRNSADHGIETIEDRVAAGKPESGTITIEARHEGGEVIIQIRDDGKGLDRDMILAKAIKQDLVQGDGSDMSDAEIFRLIFEPGFSTAEKVTDVSGRGVGMDVVKRNIEKIKGRVAVQSKPGVGTTITLHIPLTLAVIEGMLLRVAGSRYTLPLQMIRESFKANLENITMTMDGQELLKVRGEFIPIVRLHNIYKKVPDFYDLQDGIVIIVESHKDAIGLFVDEIIGQHQTVVKGLSEYLGTVRGVSGYTILGDGEVSLILDVRSLVDMVQETFPTHDGSSNEINMAQEITNEEKTLEVN